MAIGPQRKGKVLTALAIVLGQELNHIGKGALLALGGPDALNSLLDGPRFLVAAALYAARGLLDHQADHLDPLKQIFSAALIAAQGGINDRKGIDAGAPVQIEPNKGPA